LTASAGARRWLRRLAIACLATVVLGLGAYAALFVPRVYFRVAFLLIEHSSLMGDRIDWDALRARAEIPLREARTTRDTYAAIRFVLLQLGDEHSHLVSPEAARELRAGANRTLGLTAIWPEKVVALVAPDGPASEAGILVGDQLDAVDGEAPAHVGRVVLLPREARPIRLTLRRAGRVDPIDARLVPRAVPFNRPVSVRRLRGRLGYVEVPGLIGGGGTFDHDAVAAIRKADDPATCGWVVDLRRNLGGNMWPMLHAVRPILGEGNPFTYRYGKAPWAQDPVYMLKQPDPVIAVLTSRLTVSSGELLTIAFRGPGSTRTFGEATSGLTTSNASIPLVDGAILVVAVSRPADRLGRTYTGPIEPDQPVAIDWTRIGTDDDPVLEAATRWLGEQDRCRAGTGS
jgi:carboxyl-terminal processing protease